MSSSPQTQISAMSQHCSGGLALFRVRIRGRAGTRVVESGVGEARARDGLVGIELERGAPARGGFLIPLECVGEQRSAAREQCRARSAFGAVAGVLDEV